MDFDMIWAGMCSQFPGRDMILSYSPRFLPCTRQQNLKFILVKCVMCHGWDHRSALAQANLLQRLRATQRLTAALLKSDSSNWMWDWMWAWCIPHSHYHVRPSSGAKASSAVKRVTANCSGPSQQLKLSKGLRCTLSCSRGYHWLPGRHLLSSSSRHSWY